MVTVQLRLQLFLEPPRGQYYGRQRFNSPPAQRIWKTLLTGSNYTCTPMTSNYIFHSTRHLLKTQYLCDTSSASLHRWYESMDGYRQTQIKWQHGKATYSLNQSALHFRSRVTTGQLGEGPKKNHELVYLTNLETHHGWGWGVLTDGKIKFVLSPCGRQYTMVYADWCKLYVAFPHSTVPLISRRSLCYHRSPLVLATSQFLP